MEKILVVDDQETNRDFLTTLLVRYGWSIITATNGEEALGKVQDERPDLVIADVLMPGMDGYAFVRQLREAPELAATRVVFYTGTFFEEASMQLARECGVCHVLKKPASPREILRVVEEVLGTGSTGPSPEDSEFDVRHSRLLTDKLLEKVGELEALNAGLERRVQERTAELEDANRHLLALGRMKDEFIAIVSHDLRTPLSGILMGVDMLLEKNEEIGKDRQVELLEEIRRCAREQIDFVNELLDLARKQLNAADLVFTEIVAVELVEEAVQNVSSGAEAKGIELKLNAGPRVAITADRVRLLQAVINLLTNALKFTPRGGKVAISVEPCGEELMLEVADKGVGISAEDLQLLLKGLAASRTGTEGETGTGYGMAIVRQAVELHAGRLEAESTFGCGSIFRIYLPLRSARAPAGL